MDDMKREMYMRARDSILAGKKQFLCWALVDELANLCNVTWAGGKFPIQGGEALNLHQVNMFLDDVFPELFALYDGVWWVDEWLDSPKKYHIPKNPHEAWFSVQEINRRTRILDFLLTYQPSSPTLFLTERNLTMTTIFRSVTTAKGNSSYSSISQEAADKAAQALDDNFCIDCIDCIDCEECENCVGCIQCIECFDSIGCKQCTLCVNCENCIECHDCMDLIDCQNMTDLYPDTAEPSTKKA